MDKDVTGLVQFSWNDEEVLPLTRCVCGHTWRVWDHTISIYREWASACPECGRKLYFGIEIRVYEVEE